MDDESKKSGGFLNRVSGGFRDVRPDFSPGEEKAANGRGGSSSDLPNSASNPAGSDEASNREARNSGAADSLKSAEERASDGGVDSSSYGYDLNSARENETNAGGFYSGGGKSQIGNLKGKGKGKVWLKKGGPIFGIVFAIFTIGGLMSGVQSFQLFAFLANGNLDFGQSAAVLSIRTNLLIKRMLNSDGDAKYNKIPDDLRANLKKNGIDVVDTTGTDGRNLRLMIYNDPDGSKIPIVSSDSDLGRIPNSINDADLGNITLSDKHFTFDGAKQNVKNFRYSFDNATVTMTGRTAGWFDSLTTAFLRRIGGDSPRNKLSNLGNDSTEEDVKNTIFKNASKGSDNSDTSGIKKTEEDSKTGETKEVPASSDDLGRATTDEGISPNDDDSIKSGNNTSQIESKLKATATKAALGSNVACAALRAVGAINAVVAAAQVANVVDYSLKVFEASDKTRAGEGNNSFNIIANLLNTKAKSKAYYENGDEEILTGATTESNGFNAVFGDGRIVSEKEPGALMVNREYATKNALRTSNFSGLTGWSEVAGSAGMSVTAFRACMGIQVAVGIADTVADGILLFTTAGVGNAIKKFISGVLASGVVTAVVTAITTTITLITPMIGQWLEGNLEPVLMGKIGGYALHSALNILHGGNLSMSAGVNATPEMALQVYGLTKDVEQEWIAYERATLSPFDISNKNTFMGNIYFSFMPIINSINAGSVMSSIPYTVNLVDNSVSSLMGSTVSAASDMKDFKLSLASDDGCPSLSGMGVAGDVYCNKYSGAYIDDLKTRSSEEIESDISYCFNGDKIDPTSDCAKYIVSCMTNDAQPGTMSATVEGFIEGLYNKASGGSVAMGTLLGVGMNFVPGSGMIDAIDAGEQLANIEWNSQAACSNPKYRSISDYSVDQRAQENVGLIPQSKISMFLDEYYEENPIDNSFEGVIARYSGLSKEKVSETLALIDYINYVANYDVSERYAFGGDSKFNNSDDLLIEDNKLINNNVAVAFVIEPFQYFDVRNRVIVI